MLAAIFQLLDVASSNGANYHFHPEEERLERGEIEKVAQSAQLKHDAFLSSLVLMYQGRYRLALESAPQDPSESRQEQFRRYLEGMASLAPAYSVEIASDNIMLRLNPRDKVLTQEALDSLGACRDKVKSWLGIDPSTTLLAEVYRTRKDFAHASTLGDEILKKSGVIGIAKFHRLMLITPEALPFGYAWQDAMCHEYMHHALKTKAGLSLPLWFQEGVARAYEAIWRGGKLDLSPGDREELLLAAREGRLVRFERMEPSMVYLKDAEEISLAFTQVSLAVESMGPAVIKVVDLAGSGKGFARAFEAGLGKKLEVFESELWKTWEGQAQEQKVAKKSGAIRTVYSLDRTPSEAEKIFLGPDLQKFISLGDELRRKGKIGPALEIYRQAQEREPQNPYVLSRIARAQVDTGRRAQALETAKALVEANPRWPPGYELLGDLYESEALYEEAAKAYQRYFDYNPYHKELIKRTAFLLLDIAEKKSALKYLEKAAILDPADKEVSMAIQAIKASPHFTGRGKSVGSAP